MKTRLPRAIALAIGMACALPAAAQHKPPSGPNVLAIPQFIAVTENFSAAETLELAAHINMSLRQHEQAIPMYEALLRDSPRRAGLWAILAAAYNNADDPREALDAADIAITLAPHYPQFYVERGVAAFRLGRHERAVEDLKVYVQAFTVNARGHYYLGLAQASVGDTEAARVSLLRARGLNPALAPLADYYLGVIAASRGQLGAGRALFAQTQQVFEGSQLPISNLVAEQLQSVDGEVARRIRAAMHEADVRIAQTPGSPAGR
jgi:tetratricopeptide (TPR) repeat protein